VVEWTLQSQTLKFGSLPLLMGIVNVTPDSFSDGGRYLDPGEAIDQGLRLVAEGADLLDVGGESTRPGAAPVDAQEELRRVLPVVRGLCRQTPTPDSGTKRSISGSPLRAVTSLMIRAPAAMASRATMALEVSIETGTGVARQRARTTGRTRRSSSWASTGVAPGRVLSPPTSRMSAPSAARRSPWSMAACGSK
jgi:dihydropteroate synthase